MPGAPSSAFPPPPEFPGQQVTLTLRLLGPTAHLKVDSGLVEPSPYRFHVFFGGLDSARRFLLERNAEHKRPLPISPHKPLYKYPRDGL